MFAPTYIDALYAGELWAVFAAFFALSIGHALADFPLQGIFLATFKDPFHPTTGEDVPSAVRGQVVWPYCLTAHALIHAGFVWVLLLNPLLALIEFFLHWLIDLAKCRGVTGFHTDQALHMACKVAYVAAISLGWLGSAPPVPA